MKYAVCGIVICLFTADILIFLNLKAYLKNHENETVDKNEKGLMLRAVAIVVISALAAFAAAVMHFID